MSNNTTEIKYLLQRVETFHSHAINTTVDFEKLSAIIEYTTQERISASTLKRIWGYVTNNHTPRRYTLDTLAKFIGYHDYDAFCKSEISEKVSDSDFFTSFKILSADLSIGDKLEIGWSPNRYLIIDYLGDNRYKVTQRDNSKLEIGDEFITSAFMLKFPLYLANVYRGENILPTFVGGKIGGLTILSLIK